jgi:hypothetical protein
LPVFIVKMPDGMNCQFSTAASVLAVLRRGGAKLLEGDRAVLLAELGRQERAVLEGLGEEVGGADC